MYVGLIESKVTQRNFFDSWGYVQSKKCKDEQE